MNVSYPAVYESYAKFCNMIGQPVLDFESWMHAREDAGTKKITASEFIRSSLPGLPVPECSHT